MSLTGLALYKLSAPHDASTRSGSGHGALRPDIAGACTLTSGGRHSRAAEKLLPTCPASGRREAHYKEISSPRPPLVRFQGNQTRPIRSTNGDTTSSEKGVPDVTSKARCSLPRCRISSPEYVLSPPAVPAENRNAGGLGSTSLVQIR